MRVTRRIVLTHLTKALYKFSCFKEKVWSFLKVWIWQCCYFTELPWYDFAWFHTLMIFFLIKKDSICCIFWTACLVKNPFRRPSCSDWTWSTQWQVATWKSSSRTVLRSNSEMFVVHTEKGRLERGTLTT